MRSLLLRRMRSLLSTLGVLFGVAAVITMLSIGEGAKQETLEQIEQLGMNSIIIRQHAMSEEQRAQALEKKSKGLSFEDEVALRNNLPMLANEAALKEIEADIIGAHIQLSPEILAVTRSFSEIKGLQQSEGRMLGDLDFKQKNLVCVLGHDVALELGKEGHPGKTIKIDQTHFEVVGVLKPGSMKSGKNPLLAVRNLDKAVLIPLGVEKSFGKISHIDRERLSEIILQIRHSDQMKGAGELVKKVLNRLHGGYEDYQVVIPQELLHQANRTQQTFNWVLGSLAAVSLLVGGIGIMNIMLATVTERTREIGIRRAVGANKKHILMQFLLETLILTLIGGILGIIFGIVLSKMIGLIAGWRTIVTVWSVVLALAMSIVVGITSGIYPAYHAAKMDPIQSLRSN